MDYLLTFHGKVCTMKWILGGGGIHGMKEGTTRRELEAAGSSPQLLPQLVNKVCSSKENAWALISPDGILIGVGGFREIDKTTSIVWMLATDELERHLLMFHKIARCELSRYFWHHPRCTSLINAVSAENHKAIRWLDWFGAAFTARNLPIGRDDALFHTFVFKRGAYV